MPTPKTLEVSLNPTRDPADGPHVEIIENPASANGRGVRWIESDDNPYPFSFAGIELDQSDFANQKILVSKNRIVCENSNKKNDYDYVVWVRHNGKLYNSTDTSAGPAGGKAVIRNQ